MILKYLQYLVILRRSFINIFFLLKIIDSEQIAKLTDEQYKDAVIKNLSATPAGGLFRLETDRISCFDRAMLETFAKRSNVDMEVLFPIGNKKISVVIPAGYDINKLLDNKGYCGFLRLLSLLGGEIVTK